MNFQCIECVTLNLFTLYFSWLLRTQGCHEQYFSKLNSKIKFWRLQTSRMMIFASSDRLVKWTTAIFMTPAQCRFEMKLLIEVKKLAENLQNCHLKIQRTLVKNIKWLVSSFAAFFSPSLLLFPSLKALKQSKPLLREAPLSTWWMPQTTPHYRYLAFVKFIICHDLSKYIFLKLDKCSFQCGCENINCPFCNLMLSISNSDGIQ